MDKMTLDAHMPYERLPDVELGSGDTAAAAGTPTARHAQQQSPPHKRPLSLLPLIALIFFEVSGGPFGTEDAVAAAGPLLVILGFVVFPFLWSVPEALITAELATAFPENSGYVAWVSAAFGPFWGFQEGWWSWLSGVTDNSIYPVMLADNLRLFFPSLGGGWQRTAFVVALSLALTYMNYRGLQVIGDAAVTTTVLIIAPFVLLCVFAAPAIDPRNWLAVDLPSVQWGTFLNIMFWNLNYWDSVSCLAGEVDRPAKTFPRAMLWAVVLVVLSYLLPTMAALGVMPEAGDWELGYYGKVAQTVAGDWLALWVVVAAAASQIGQFQAEMSSDAFQLQGMAERGFLPKALARRSRHGTPTIGILLSSLGVCFLSFFDFVSIVELLNAIYCLAELLEFAAFVALRVTAPNLPRPYRVPLPTWGLVVMLAPATALLITVLVLPVFAREWVTVSATGLALLSGFVLYPLLTWLKDTGRIDFANLEFDFAHHVFSASPVRPSSTPGVQGRATVPPADGRPPPRRSGSYTITARGALHYDGDDFYDVDNFVDVTGDASGRRTVTRSASVGPGLSGGRALSSTSSAGSFGWMPSSRVQRLSGDADGGGGLPAAAAVPAVVAPSSSGSAALRDVASFKLVVSDDEGEDNSTSLQTGAKCKDGRRGTIN